MRVSVGVVDIWPHTRLNKYSGGSYNYTSSYTRKEKALKIYSEDEMKETNED